MKYSVSPPLGVSIKEIRAVHSEFLTELQQLVAAFAKEKFEANNETVTARNEKETLQNEKTKLISAIEALNKVKLNSFSK